MHRITFYPVGNAHCCRIDLDDGKATRQPLRGNSTGMKPGSGHGITLATN
jgi:hypothetical protein